MKPKTKNDSDVLNTGPRRFQAILQLYQLVDALIADRSKLKYTSNNLGATRKPFDYIDAITNLMVRSDEVVAAVSCDGQPGHHIISVNSPARETPGGNAQVRPQYPSCVW